MKTKKGISLIVLVITIIVMIILVAAIIITLSNNGIIGKANDAVEVTNLKQAQQIAETRWSEAYSYGLRTQEKLEEYVLEKLSEDGITTNYFDITVTEKGVVITLKKPTLPEPDYENMELPVPESWVSATVDGVPIPYGFVASPYEGEKTQNGGLVIYELTKKEIITGVKSLPTDESHYTSLTTRNQYVWVSVDKEMFDETFLREDHIYPSLYHVVDANGNYYAIGGNNYWEITPTTELTETNLKYITAETLTEVQEMYASVKEYGGFYIARYESGIDTQRTSKESDGGVSLPRTTLNVHSKMGKIPYTYIPWTWSESINNITSGAVEVARGLYPSNANYGVVSTLTYGVQWDTTLNWWLDTGAKNSLGKTITVTDSRTYGNYTGAVIAAGDLNKDAKYAVYESYKLGTYQDVQYDIDGNSTSTKSSTESWALTTGALKASCINNIYDMAGNMNEWTMEGKYNHSYTARGGTFEFNGISYPAAYRNNQDADSGWGHNICFRTSLYIKSSDK